LEVEVIEETENPLLYRTEIKFVVRHEDGGTPTRAEVLKKLAAVLDVDKEVLLLDRMESEFGKRETVGYAKVYESVEKLEEIEPEHKVERHRRVLEQIEEEKKEEEGSEEEGEEGEGEEEGEEEGGE